MFNIIKIVKKCTTIFILAIDIKARKNQIFQQPQAFIMGIQIPEMMQTQQANVFFRYDIRVNTGVHNLLNVPLTRPQPTL
ncbi:TPA: hypothetical protein QEN11_07570 [Stenotrophomonas maltophilia]|nr:hypothetical protein [Stenotrophomonas maltophilia]